MTLKTILCASAALAALCAPAYADDAAIEKRLDAMQHMIDAQQSQIEAQNTEIKNLHSALRKKGVAVAHGTTPATSAPPPTPEQVTAQNARIDALNRKFEDAQAQTQIAKADAPKVSFQNGRFGVASPDGRFSLAIRALGQFDTAYYMQGGHARTLANGADFSSGANFRRAQLGLQGKLFGDWSYLINTEFGGSGGTESGGRVQSLYLQYNGFKPFAFRLGAFPPDGGLEDSTGAADTLFLERAGPSDIIRNAIGGDGRDAATLFFDGGGFHAALSYTGAKVGEAAEFDEQQAVLLRVADSIWSDSDSRIVLSATGADMFRGADSSPANVAVRSLTLSAAPELTVDSGGTKLVSTGALDTENARFWGAEAGANWRSLYAQAGYFGYEITQRLVPHSASKPKLNFDGWYAQASWVLTGESRGYNDANAAFTAPKPRVAFSPSTGGWGAWELAARYSDIDLDDNSGTFGLATPFGGVRGGEQKIWSTGVNWYPNSILRFSLDYQWIDVDRLSGAGSNIGQKLQALSLRSQISL